MAYDTYSGLKATVADYLHRSDLDSRIPGFIRLAEQAINRRLKIFPKEIEAPLVSVPGSRFVALPSDYGSPIELSTSYVEPRFVFTMADTSQLVVDDVNARQPLYWAVDGANIAFECPTDQAYQLQLRYLQNLFLSDVNPTNPLFNRANDLYLYGALVHSVEFTQNDARRPGWQSKFNSILNGVAEEAARSKSMAPLQTEIPGSLGCSQTSMRSWYYF